MNISMVKYFLGWILRIEGALMILPCVIAVIFRETSGFFIAGVALAAMVLGWALSYKRPDNTIFYAREGFVSVALGWIVLSLAGAAPFYISGEIPVFVDAFFEVVSGFTTTGASILSNVEGLSRCMLMWRSFTHWIGGMGVLVFILAILPMAGGYNMHIMRAESPGPSVGKLVPKVRSTAKILYLIYFVMTAAMFLILLVFRMPWFDALCISVGTAGTGGFGILNDSCGSYSTAQQAVTTIFMILFGVNFNAYYLLLIKKPKDAFGSEEVRGYLGIIFISILLITCNIYRNFGSVFEAFHHAAFQVASIITTSGFSTVDFDLWPAFSKTILVLLMFVGACAGSTGGGIKVSRIMISLKTVKKELSSLIHPRSIKVLKFEGKTIEHNVLRSINTYLVAYFLIFSASVLLVSLDNFDPTTNFTAVAATLNNIGPGLSEVGPTCNFGVLGVLSKYVLIFDMLAGRLELFPMLVLFSSGTWKKE